ncbi:MAG: hypothetical protein LBR87_01885 [Synergistaceae bacterium]|jgi:lipopolysaccharide export system protein LptA|nr:hypothetical protein [Synergistaceae bacterium]
MANVKKLPAPLVICALAVSFLCAAVYADDATLTADSMKYDPATGMITAEGSVRLTGLGGELTGDSGRGAVSGSDFEMKGNVRGRFTDKDGSVISIKCAAASMKGREIAGSVVTASGDVELTRGKEILTADVVRWTLGGAAYSADGQVLGNFTGYSIDADSVSRDADRFEADGVRKFYEASKKITMSASQAEGALNGNEVTEMTASGGVVATVPDRSGRMTRLSGSSAVYSLARGTLVVSGRVIVTQTGRSLKSDSIVYFLDSGHIDAHGSPSLTFGTDRR